jgi:uncharacterized protein YdeI (YjbR/CyaY-like superfamily)
VPRSSSKSPASPKVDAFLRRQTKWRPAYEKLRAIIRSTGLTEDLKWGQPCYALGGKNVVLMHGFKEYCAILFPKGVLLPDPKGVLIQQTPNVQAARQIRFTSAGDVTRLEKTVKAYVLEAIEIERAGRKVTLKNTEDFEVPEELARRLDSDAKLRAAFRSLTPGRQRRYLFFFAQPKLAATREARIEKNVPRILAGLGLDD